MGLSAALGMVCDRTDMATNVHVKAAEKPGEKRRSFSQRLTSYYLWFTAGFVLLLVVLSILEREGFPRVWLGYLFIFSTIVMYAGIGFMSRTSDVAEYYVAGRRVPA